MTETATTARHVPADLPERIQHYIDGEFVDSIDGDTFDVLEPVTNEVYVTAAAMRLARFNIQAGSVDKRYFVGMPSQSAATVPASTSTRSASQPGARP